jgi:hypothetical protein
VHNDPNHFKVIKHNNNNLKNQDLLDSLANVKLDLMASCIIKRSFLQPSVAAFIAYIEIEFHKHSENIREEE